MADVVQDRFEPDVRGRKESAAALERRRSRRIRDFPNQACGWW
jgi:hypothetical protein